MLPHMVKKINRGFGRDGGYLFLLLSLKNLAKARMKVQNKRSSSNVMYSIRLTSLNQRKEKIFTSSLQGKRPPPYGNSTTIIA